MRQILIASISQHGYEYSKRAFTFSECQAALCASDFVFKVTSFCLIPEGAKHGAQGTGLTLSAIT